MYFLLFQFPYVFHVFGRVLRKRDVLNGMSDKETFVKIIVSAKISEKQFCVNTEIHLSRTKKKFRDLLPLVTQLSKIVEIIIYI